MLVVGVMVVMALVLEVVVAVVVLGVVVESDMQRSRSSVVVSLLLVHVPMLPR